MVPGLHHGNIYNKRKLMIWRDQKCIRLVGAKTILPCAGRQNRAKTGKLRKLGGGPGQCNRVCTNGIFIQKGSYGYGETRNVFR